MTAYILDVLGAVILGALIGFSQVLLRILRII